VASAEHATFSGVIQDQTGTRLPGVTVTVRNEVAKSERAAVTDIQGAFALAALEEGSYRVEVRLEGLEPAIVSHLALKNGEVTRAKVVLRFIPTESIVVGAIVNDPITSSSGTTVFTQELINKLPM